MELKPIEGNVLDLEFEIPEPGASILQFQEGITKRTNETSGKTTLQLPMIIDKVVEGPETNEGRKLSHFCPIETDFGERQLAGILTITGLMDSFAGKFGTKVDVMDDKFINALKLKLPGKFVKGTHVLRKDQQGKDRANVVRFEGMNSSAPVKGTPKADKESAAGGGHDDSDW